MTLADDFKHLSFIGYRILPFVIICYFFISAILSGDLSGFLILVGIVLSSIITIIVSKSQIVIDNLFNMSELQNIDNSNLEPLKDKLTKCNFITLGNSPLSFLPLSTHIYWFLFSYFLYVMGINNVLARNWFLLLLMSVLLAFDSYYNINACVGNLIAIPVIIGAAAGIGWAVIVGPKNHMIPLLSTKNQCSAQTSRYNCRIKRTGQIINT
jgi:hypothetical protein